MKKRYIFCGPALIIVGFLFILAACSVQTPKPVLPTSVPTQTPALLATSTTVAPTKAAPTAETAPTEAPTTEATGAAGPTAGEVFQLVNDKFNTVNRDLALWNIQPGLGTVMMEYGNRLARMWFAANADNWDMVKYQLDEMIEIQEVGETTRPNRAPMLKAFEEGSITALDAAIKAKDKTAFTKAFEDTLTGCNTCHTASTGDQWASYKFVHIQQPKTDPAFYLDWKGGGQENYITSPAESPAATETTPPSGNLDAAGVEQLVNNAFNTVDRSLALWNIQPGLGTVMIEFGNRFSRMYFAAKAGNWDMAKYQLDEMIEIQEVGETTRPNRAPMLKAFEDGFLTPLDQAIAAKDENAFDTAFSAAEGGCNACHTASSGTEWASYKFVKIQIPTADNNDYIVWKAEKPTGNYIANPSPAATTAATTAPTTALTSTLDMAGVEKLVNDKFNIVDRTLALWNIQPGLGTVMIEYGKRMAQIKFAVDAGNWDMAKYQLDEMIEIQEVGETTRPNRAPMLKAFEDGFLKSLDEAILAQDSAAANSALANVVTGCNSCHAASQGTEWASYAFVQIQLPKSDPADYIQWNTEGGTGNYKP